MKKIIRDIVAFWEAFILPVTAIGLVLIMVASIIGAITGNFILVGIFGCIFFGIMLTQGLIGIGLGISSICKDAMKDWRKYKETKE